MIEGVDKVVLVEATPFQKLHRSLSSSPIFSGLLAFRKWVFGLEQKQDHIYGGWMA